MTARLSYAERRVADRLVTGATNRAIADELGVSVDTVKSQVRAIMRKFDAHTRTEAAVKLRNPTGELGEAALARHLLAEHRDRVLAPVRALIDAAPNRRDCRFAIPGVGRRILIDVEELRRAIADTEEAS